MSELTPEPEVLETVASPAEQAPSKLEVALRESVLAAKVDITKLPPEWHAKLQAAFWKSEARRLATEALNLQLGHAVRNHQEAQADYLRVQLEANLALGTKLGTEQDWTIETGDIQKINIEPPR